MSLVPKLRQNLVSLVCWNNEIWCPCISCVLKRRNMVSSLVKIAVQENTSKKKLRKKDNLRCCLSWRIFLSFNQSENLKTTLLSTNQKIRNNLTYRILELIVLKNILEFQPIRKFEIALIPTNHKNRKYCKYRTWNWYLESYRAS